MSARPKSVHPLIRPLRPGDIVMTNDPWMGTGHLFDINVMRPVFRDDRLVGYTMSVTHLPDIGGSGMSSTCTLSIFSRSKSSPGG